jgi:CheY-like chemotaxis protein
MVSDETEVMLVEDDLESRISLARLLQLEGFKVVAFANGAAALSHLEQSPLPRLIIMDMQMPAMGGLEFRSAMLRNPRLANIPVIITTAFEPPAAANLSALRVLRKPIDVDALLAAVRSNC